MGGRRRARRLVGIIGRVGPVGVEACGCFREACGCFSARTLLVLSMQYQKCVYVLRGRLTAVLTTVRINSDTAELCRTVATFRIFVHATLTSLCRAARAARLRKIHMPHWILDLKRCRQGGSWILGALRGLDLGSWASPAGWILDLGRGAQEPRPGSTGRRACCRGA